MLAGASTNTQVDAPTTVDKAAASPALDVCPVCMHIYNQFQRAYLPCGHSMYINCIQEWVDQLERQHLEESTLGILPAAALERLPKPTCPMCRAEVIYSCGHVVRRTQFDAGPLTLDHWAQLCTDCQDDEVGYDEFSDDDGSSGGSDGSSQDSGSAVS